MTTGRTYWWGKDAAWWRRELIVELGEEFGPAGPAVIDWLSCEAKAQNAAGVVKTGCKSIARGCFVDVVTVSHVVSRSVTLGVLDDYQDLGSRFVCRISGWASDQRRARAADRKAEERANTGDSDPVVTLGHAESRSVTECPPRGRGEERNTETPLTPKGGNDKSSPDLGPNDIPVPPTGNRGREHVAYEERLERWTALHMPDWSAQHVRHIAGFLRGRVDPLGPDALREFARENPQWAPSEQAA